MKTLENKKAVADFPELADQWHPTKNGDFKPCDVAAGSHEKFWWQCKKVKEHIWPAKACNRSRGSGCPYCTGRKVSIDNCLSTTHPELAKEWHPTENGDLTPNDVTSGSGKKVWWMCEKEHEWLAAIGDRVRGNGCPYCSGQKPCFENCLLTNRPEIAAQWHPTKNNKLTPKDVTAFSHKKVWWMCEKGHEWPAVIAGRVRGNGCKKCSGKEACFENCLLTNRPEIAAQWHPTKNNKLTPKDVTPGSNKKVWWQCKKGHEWDASIGNRTQGRNCPKCNESKGENRIVEFLESFCLPFKRQFKFKKCRLKRSLPFDFLVKIDEKKGFLIEYQGQQHYRLVPRSKSWTNEKAMNELEIIQKNDRIKAKWARKNKIPLLIIPYWDYEKIPERISNFLNTLK